jgi:hypothetical protein
LDALPGDEMMIEAYVRQSGGSGYRTICEKALQGTGCWPWYFYLADRQPRASVKSCVTTYGPVTLTADTWHYVALKFANNFVWIYVDSTVAAAPWPGGPTMDTDELPVYLGARFHQSDGLQAFFNGEMAEVRISSRIRKVIPTDALPASIPARYVLYQNVPNPFNPTTAISFELPRRAQVALAIFDTAGRHVRDLVNTELGPGRHTVVWNATDGSGTRVPSGVYLYEIVAGDYRNTKKLVLLK